MGKIKEDFAFGVLAFFGVFWRFLAFWGILGRFWALKCNRAYLDLDSCFFRAEMD